MQVLALVALVLVAAIYLAGVIVWITSVRHAPFGYEDERGFHRLREPERPRHRREPFFPGALPTA